MKLPDAFIFPSPCTLNPHEVSDYSPDFYEETNDNCKMYHERGTWEYKINTLLNNSKDEPFRLTRKDNQCPSDISLDGNLCHLQHHLRVTGYDIANIALLWQSCCVVILLVVLFLSCFLIFKTRHYFHKNKSVSDYIPHIFAFMTLITLSLFCLNNYFVEKNQLAIIRGQENAFTFCRAALKEYDIKNRYRWQKTSDNLIKEKELEIQKNELEIQKIVVTECLQTMTKAPTSGNLNSIAPINYPPITK